MAHASCHPLAWPGSVGVACVIAATAGRAHPDTVSATACESARRPDSRPVLHPCTTTLQPPRVKNGKWSPMRHGPQNAPHTAAGPQPGRTAVRTGPTLAHTPPHAPRRARAAENGYRRRGRLYNTITTKLQTETAKLGWTQTASHAPREASARSSRIDLGQVCKVGTIRDGNRVHAAGAHDESGERIPTSELAVLHLRRVSEA